MTQDFEAANQDFERLFVSEIFPRQNRLSVFHVRLKLTFGPDFYAGILANGSQPYKKENDWAIDFIESGYTFTLIIRPQGWILQIYNGSQVAIANEVLDPGSPEEMVFLFQGLKVQMITELEQRICDAIKADRAIAEETEALQDSPDLFLPNTLLRLADWECQLILEFIRSGCEAPAAITKAKHLVWLQTHSPDGEPGNLSIIDKCKSRAKVDTSQTKRYEWRFDEEPLQLMPYVIVFVNDLNQLVSTICTYTDNGWDASSIQSLDVALQFKTRKVVGYCEIPGKAY